MITIDLSMFVELVGFLILMVMLNSMLYKPIRRMLEERESRMSSIQSDVEKFERNADQLLKDFDRKMADARSAGQGELERLKQEAREEEHRLSDASSKEADAKKQDLMKDLTAQIEAARKDLSAKVDAFAVEISQKLLGRAV